MSSRNDIFISYPGGGLADSEAVRRLSQSLDTYGFHTWYAEKDPSARAGYSSRYILDRLRSSSVFLAGIGSHRPGRWGRNELATAAEIAEQTPDYLLAVVLFPGSDPAQVKTLPEPFHGAPVFDMRKGAMSVAPLVALLWQRLVPDRARLLKEVATSLRSSETSAVLLTGKTGSGKSSLAVVVLSQLAHLFPDGQAIVDLGQSRGVEGALGLAMRMLDVPGFDSRQHPPSQYRERLAKGRYLVVFDEVHIPDATDLVAPPPSATLIVSQMRPEIRVPHAVFQVLPAVHRSEHERSDESLAATRPSFSSDSPSGADLLGVEDQVSALCSLMAAKEVEPPLSIGLFGEWGAGKTFFIEKMRTHIDHLAAASQSAPESAFCPAIKQIVFNVWHYADANLWASLALRVFEGLGEQGDESKQLIEELASSRVQLERASAEQEEAEQQVRRAENDQRETQRELDQAKVELSDLAAAAVDILDEVQDPAPVLEDIRIALHLNEEARITINRVKDLRSLHGAMAELWRRSKGTLILLFAAVLATVALVVFLPSAPVAAVALAASLALALRVVGWPLRWVLNARAKARERTEALLRQRSVKLQSRLEQLRNEETEARHQRTEALRRVERAEAAVADIKSGRRLFQFIDERSRGDAYEPYLGLIALVRRDFERLSELIQGQVQDGSPEGQQLQRIVLYIDDLDRCPADRVVEVLEATHLLMASKLFVVVVAVDPRWLLSSLARHYTRQMISSEDRRWSPTPQDYLEKIFQIPFSLPRMDDEGFRRLIESLMHSDEPLEQTEEEPSSPPEQPSGPVPMTRPEELPVTETAHAQDPVLELNPPGLRVLQEEIDFMAKLSPLLRTPRSAKRLANLYRLIRVSLTHRELEELLGRTGGAAGYPSMQLMLAISIGFPTLSHPFLRAVASAQPDDRWWEFVGDWKPPPLQATDWESLLEAIVPLRKESFPHLASFHQWMSWVGRYSYDSLTLAAARA